MTMLPPLPPLADLDASHLTPVLAQVLAQIFTSYGLAASPSATPPVAPIAVAVVGFEGPRSGLLALRLDARGATAMATTLLGGFPPESDAERDDALGEWANITAGNLKTRALDPTGTFRLGLPVVGDGTAPGTETPARLCFSLPDQGTLEVALVLDQAA